MGSKAPPKGSTLVMLIVAAAAVGGRRKKVSKFLAGEFSPTSGKKKGPKTDHFTSLHFTFHFHFTHN